MSKSKKQKTISFEETIQKIKDKVVSLCERAYKEAGKLAKEYAESNSKSESSTPISTYVDAIRAEHQNIQAQIEGDLNGEEIVLDGGFNEQANKKKRLELEEEQRAASQEHFENEERIKGLKQLDLAQLSRVNVMLYLIAFAEGAITSAVVHLTTTSLLITALMICAFTAVYYGIPKGLIILYQKIAHLPYRKPIMIGVVMLLGVFYFGIAQIRTLGDPTFTVSPWLFVGINYAFLGVAIYYAWRRGGLECTPKEKREWKEAQAKKKEFEAKLESFEMQLKENKEQHDLAQEYRLRLLGSINVINKQIDTHFLKSVQHFKAEVRRWHGADAPDINNPVEPINFEHFNVINKLKSLQS